MPVASDGSTSPRPPLGRGRAPAGKRAGVPAGRPALLVLVGLVVPGTGGGLTLRARGSFGAVVLRGLFLRVAHDHTGRAQDLLTDAVPGLEHLDDRLDRDVGDRYQRERLVDVRVELVALLGVLLQTELGRGGLQRFPDCLETAGELVVL